MAVIGTFTATKDGGWAGTIRTLMIDVKVRLVPNDNRDNLRVPDFRVYAGGSEVGAAWRERTGDESSREYLRVRLDDPCLPESISVAMFASSDGSTAQIVWNRRRSIQM
ncbi:MAG: DUF736 family protein [Gammaproteobacteria bacterium]|uniref:DUF736 domain-containing protein n=1 Tax=Thalassobaculum sp. TaxID=2022740 RepID=UPI0032EAFA53